MEIKMLSPELVHPLALQVCRTLSQNGYQAYIVGGCVRDLLMGAPPKDWDITTDATPQEDISLFPKTIPTGLQHGTVTVVMGEGVENHFEVTTFRIEGEYLDGRRPEEVFFVLHVDQDLARRDLTINAIAFDPIAQRFADPYNGLQDLKSGLLRAVGSPGARFREDGLRIMRVARFAARFGYAVDLATFEGMCENIDTLKKVSKERIQDELCKTLVAQDSSYGFQLLERCGALQVACPLMVRHPIDQNGRHDLHRCSGDLETRLAFLYAHCPVKEVNEELMNLKFSNKEIKRVMFLLQLIERYRQFIERDSELAYKSFMAVIKNHSPDPWTHSLEQFIHLTEALGYLSREQFEKYADVVVLTRRELQINGDDLVQIGIKPGPQIKNVLEQCYLEVLRYPEHNTRGFLLDFATGC